MAYGPRTRTRQHGVFVVSHAERREGRGLARSTTGERREERGVDRQLWRPCGILVKIRTVGLQRRGVLGVACSRGPSGRQQIGDVDKSESEFA